MRFASVYIGRNESYILSCISLLYSLNRIQIQIGNVREMIERLRGICTKIKINKPPREASASRQQGRAES